MRLPLIPCLVLVLAGASLGAADAGPATTTDPRPNGATAPPAPGPALATWTDGSGTVGGTALAPGDAIRPGAAVQVGSGVGVLTLAGAPGSTLRLAPNSAVSLLPMVESDGRPALAVELAEGRVEADINGLGDYAAIHVRGAVMDVRVTGTIFVVERVRRDADYVAMVKGRVTVSLRREVAALVANGGQEIDLSARQGIEATRSSGFGAVGSLAYRPDLAATRSVQSAASEGGEGSLAWGDIPVEGAIPGDDLVDAISESVSDAISDEVSETITNEVIDSVLGGGDAPLGPPPGPPN